MQVPPKCQASLANDKAFYYGQLPYVGKRYDSNVDGKPLRLIIAGISEGSQKRFTDMEDRYDVIYRRSGLENNFENRNHHMRGTTLIVRRLFKGRERIAAYDDRSGEFIVERGEERHIFDYFALVNLLICSSVLKGANSNSDKSSPAMRQYCLNHFKKAIEVLEPTVIVFQSKSAFNYPLREWNNAGSWIPLGQSQYFGRYQRGGLKFVTCVLYHPSYPGEFCWGRKGRLSSYCQRFVLPALESLSKLCRLG